MRHFFIINPASGQNDSSKILIDAINKIFEQKNEEYEIYVTKAPKDSFRIASEKSSNLVEETIFYACGGDGTSFDVINGIACKPNAYFAVIPIGSCNDFLKTFPEYNFKDLESLINGNLKNIDICKINEYYFLNELNIGFDARVNDDCNNSKIKAKSVKKAYNRAIIKNLISFKSQNIKVSKNNEVIKDQKMLLLVLANGRYYGGKYCCAPFAEPNDGYMDLVAVRKISRFTFVSLIKAYEVGDHLRKEKYKKFVDCQKVDKVTIESPEDMVVCLDGEIFHWKKVSVEVIKHGIKMLFPKEKVNE